jgi:tetratricopeptide (TPR) repeat protein
VQGTDIEGLLKKGLEALAQGDTLSALSCFEKAISIEKSPVAYSYYAFCIAKERGQVSKAISLCEEAIQKEPGNSLHYINLGRIYLIDNKKEEAIKTFRAGLNYETNPIIVDELNKLGPRKPPIIPFLKRSNPINKYLGIMLRTKKRLKILYLVLSLLLAVTVASVLLPLLFSEKPKVTPPPSEVRHEVTPPPSEVKQTVTPPPPEVLPEVPPPPPKVKHEYPAETKHDTLHTLELFAEDTSWIFITIDDSESKEVLLHQGDRIKWSAKNIFSLKIGNAGGIKLIFDGKEIGPLGEEGQVVTLKLPPPTNSTSDTLETNSETE